jgi:hypothetical protein
MSGRTISAGEALLRSRLQEKLLKTDKRNGKEWKHRSGGLFRFAKGL